MTYTFKRKRFLKHPLTKLFIKHPEYSFIYKIFIIFLIRNNAFFEFLNNFKKTNHTEYNLFGFETINHVRLGGLINFGFIWKDTLEGHDYWAALHEKWYEIYEAIKPLVK